MVKSDLYIGAGGTTTWERCCLSLRSLVITSATNQIELTKVLHESSDICYIGHANSVSSDQILTAFESNLDLQDQSKASHFTDGLGAFRICLSLLNQKIDVRIRQVVLDDLSLFGVGQMTPLLGVLASLLISLSVLIVNGSNKVYLPPQDYN